MASPRAPIALTDCRARVEHRGSGRYGTAFLPSAAYRNVAAKTVAEVAISITTLDALGADIEERVHSDSPNFDPGRTFASHWIDYAVPPDVSAVRCAVRAVEFEDGSRWGTWPDTPDERNREFRPVPCGPLMDRPQAAVTLREPAAGARNVDPRHARLVLRSEDPNALRVSALRLVPESGPVLRRASFAELRELYDSLTEKAPFEGTITVGDLAPATSYRVVVDVLDTQRSTARCPVVLELALGTFTTAR